MDYWLGSLVGYFFIDYAVVLLRTVSTTLTLVQQNQGNPTKATTSQSQDVESPRFVIVKPLDHINDLWDFYNFTVCQAVKKCKDCLKVYRVIDRKITAPFLRREILLHLQKVCAARSFMLYIQKISPEKNPSKKGFLFVFFDLECTQSTPSETPGEFIHRPNLCVARQHCYRCLDDLNAENDCLVCGRRLHIFRGDECIAEFFQILLNPKKQFSEIVALSHYGKGYDNVHFRTATQKEFS